MAGWWREKRFRFNFSDSIFLTVRKIGSEKWLEVDNHILQESSHLIPALIINALQPFASSHIIPNLPEKWQTGKAVGVTPKHSTFLSKRSSNLYFLDVTPIHSQKKVGRAVLCPPSGIGKGINVTLPSCGGQGTARPATPD